MASPDPERAAALHRAGKLKEAVAAYRAVVKAQPRNFDALYNLGMIQAQAGRFQDAAKWVARALEIDPGFVRGHFDLGSLYGQLGRFDLAIESLKRADALAPDNTDVLHNLGNALSESGRLEEALSVFDRALALKPDFALAHFNRANVLKAAQHHEAAIEGYRAALALKPDHVQALNNMGNCLYQLRRDEEAAAAFQRALKIDPDYTHPWFNLGQLQQRRNLWQEARASFERVVALAPDYPFGLGALMDVHLQCCDWSGVAKNLKRVTAAVRAGKPVIDPFAFMALSDSTADQLACARIWVAQDCPPAPAVWRGETYRHDRIRLAYVSADFHEHPMAYMMSGLFEHHDRSRFETIAIAFDADTDSPARRRMKQAFDHFIVVDDMTDADIARKMREMEIDIAVDRKGFTRNGRPAIFAARPAPVQVSYLAYPGTMGAPYIDYIIADSHVIPPGQEKSYSEKVVRLPETYQVTDRDRLIDQSTPSRAAAGLPDTGFVFCSFNNNYKITQPFFDVWMDLLRQVDGSVLWLYQKNPVAVQNLMAAAQEKGITPDRICFGAHVENPAHMARLRLADLCLDTLPYGAHSTACDALQAGVPIIACRGRTFVGAVTSSVLHAIGLPELVTNSLSEYKALALKLAREPDTLAAFRARLAENIATQPLFDTARFTRHIEAAYVQMWERRQRGEPPAAFDIAPIG